MLKRLGISRQLLLLVLSFTVIMAAGTGYYHTALNRVAAASEAQSHDAVRRLGSSYDLLDKFVAAQSAIQILLREKDPDQLEKLLADYKRGGEAISLAVQAEANQDLTSAFNAWNTSSGKVIDRILQGNAAEASALFFSTQTPLFARALSVTDQTHAAVSAQIESESAATAASVRSTGRRAMATMAGLCAVILVAGLTIRRSMMSQLRSTCLTMREMSQSLHTVSSQMSAASQGLAKGASEQASSLEETNSSMVEVTAMSTTGAQSAATAAKTAADARESARSGEQEMSGMVSAMDAIQSASGEISKIIRTIDEIAFQTNILALNAAVEAARAGQAGVGFAVVADAVRTLAQRSAQAAAQSASCIEDAINKTKLGIGACQRVGEHLTQIVSHSARVDSVVGEIAETTRRQRESFSQITASLAQIGEVTQSSAAGAEQAAAAAEQLESEVNSLQACVAALSTLVDGAARSKTGIPGNAAAHISHAQVRGATEPAST
jgi:methyl-accepting chemotaxis protein